MMIIALLKCRRLIENEIYRDAKSSSEFFASSVFVLLGIKMLNFDVICVIILMFVNFKKYTKWG